MTDQTIIVFGISGVGKTTVCRRFVETHSRYVHVSASQLLKDATGTEGERLRTMDDASIRRNQRYIGVALDARRAEYGTRPILIDAHSVIDNDRLLVPIPDETIESMRPDALIFLEEEPEVILSRRAGDSRIRPFRSTQDILSHQNLARTIAAEYSRLLDVPIAIGKIKDQSDFEGMFRACRMAILD